MKETIYASVAGIGFKFEPEAYGILKDYLDRIGREYATNPDGEEIINDIEARIVEIILTEQAAEQIVGRPLIDMVVGRLGYPEDTETGTAEEQGAPEPAFPKRLYRNPEGAKAGGVIAGLASFFRADPALLRMAFFVPGILAFIFRIFRLNNINAFSHADQFFWSLQLIFAVLYVLAWIVVPLARTPRQKLEMQGRDVTASTIEQTVKADAVAMPKGAARVSTVFSELLTIIGRILVVIIKICLGFVGVVLALAALGILTAMIYLAINGESWLLSGIAGGAWFDPVNTFTFRWDLVILLSVALIPVVIFSLMFFNVISKRRIPGALFATLAALWLVAVGYSAITLPIKKTKLLYYADESFKSRIVTSMDKAGFYVVKDAPGNIVVGTDTIAHANESLTTEQLAGRVNRIFGDEFHVNYKKDFADFGMEIRSSVPGPKYRDSELAREEAKSRGLNVKDNTPYYGYTWHEHLPCIWIRYEFRENPEHPAIEEVKEVEVPEE